MPSFIIFCNSTSWCIFRLDQCSPSAMSSSQLKIIKNNLTGSYWVCIVCFTLEYFILKKFISNNFFGNFSFTLLQAIWAQMLGSFMIFRHTWQIVWSIAVWFFMVTYNHHVVFERSWCLLVEGFLPQVI